MNYFITGGTGFIGTHLARLLHEVHPEAKLYNLDMVKPSDLADGRGRPLIFASPCPKPPSSTKP